MTYLHVLDRRIGGATLHILASLSAVEGKPLDAARLWGAGSVVMDTGPARSSSLTAPAPVLPVTAAARELSFMAPPPVFSQTFFRS